MKNFRIWKVGQERLYGEDLKDCLLGHSFEARGFTALDAAENWAQMQSLAETEELFFGKEIDEQAECYVIAQEVGSESKLLCRVVVTLRPEYWPEGVEEISA